MLHYLHSQNSLYVFVLLSLPVLAEVPGGRHEVFYDCCAEPYPDVTFVVTLRRRTLFYALNLLLPCVLLSSMTLVVFLLPANSGEKISLGEEKMKGVRRRTGKRDDDQKMGNKRC